MLRIAVVALLLILQASSAAAARWVAFIAPDFEQTRTLHAGLQRQMLRDPVSKDVELRFIPVPHTTDRSQLEPPIVQAINDSPLAIIAAADSIAFVARDRTSRIPIIFGSGYDPVANGLVRSLAKPGGNITGFTSFSEIELKQLALLREIAPSAKTIGLLDDGAWFGTRLTQQQIEAFERSNGVKIVVFTGKEPSDMPKFVRSPEGARMSAWFVPINNLTGISRDELVAAIHEARKPALYGRTFFVERGGLASYQELIPSPTALWHEMLVMVLKGTPAGDIPVRRAKDFVLALNLDEAEHLAKPFPRSLLLRADRVISKRLAKP